MAVKKLQTPQTVKGRILVTPKGKALFVSVPNASSYDETKQEASLLLTKEDADILKAQLTDFIESAEVKEAGLNDIKFIDSLFKDDTDADGNLTGLLRIKAKTAMKYPAKLYAANGDTFTPDVGFSIPNRASIKMSVRPEVMTTSMFTGLVLRLQAIKIFELPEFDDGMSNDEDNSGSFSAPSPATPQAASDSNADEAIDAGW